MKRLIMATMYAVAGSLCGNALWNPNAEQITILATNANWNASAILSTDAVCNRVGTVTVTNIVIAREIVTRTLVQEPCPDRLPGCCVGHFRWIDDSRKFEPIVTLGTEGK